MLPCLDNFISYGKDVFIQRPDYRAMAVDIYTTSMSSEHLGENDRVNGSKIAESFLLNLRGHVDDVGVSIELMFVTDSDGCQALSTFITTALKCMDQPPETRALKIANLNVLVNAILYNPSVTLQVLEAQGATRRFFEVWFNTINADGGLPRVHSKRLSILAICALLEIDPAAVPHSLQEGWSGILAGVLKIIRELPGAVEGESQDDVCVFLVVNVTLVIVARKVLFEKHAHDEEDEDEEYSVDDLNLEGDAGGLFLDLLARDIYFAY